MWGDDMKLEFNAESHEYRINGKIVPSVTEICAPLTAADMGKLNPNIINSAANRGSIIHELTELIDYGTSPEDMEMYAEVGGYITAYLRFLRDYSPTWTRIEYRLGNEDLGFARTLDRLGVIDDKPCVLDIKTTDSASRAQKISWATQLSGYRLLCGNATLERYVLWLRSDGTYVLYNILDFEKKYNFWGARIFSQLLEINKALKGE
jgi:hypothetical protein